MKRPPNKVVYVYTTDEIYDVIDEYEEIHSLTPGEEEELWNDLKSALSPTLDKHARELLEDGVVDFLTKLERRQRY